MSGHLTLSISPTQSPKNGTAYQPGEVITFIIRALNDSSVNLWNISVAESLTDSHPFRSRLNHGGDTDILVGYRVTEDDAQCGFVQMDVTAVAEDVNGIVAEVSPASITLPCQG